MNSVSLRLHKAGIFLSDPSFPERIVFPSGWKAHQGCIHHRGIMDKGLQALGEGIGRLDGILKVFDYTESQVDMVLGIRLLLGENVPIGIRNKGGKHACEWTATGKQFQVPYVFKTLFSHEEIIFDDLCETRSVKTAMYLDMNEGMGEDEHNYIFVGRVGRFCPIIAGKGGGQLMRRNGDGTGYGAVGGTKGYRWLESSLVKNLGKEDDIDRSYYQRLADDAVNDISKFGSFNEFVDGPLPVEAYVNAVPFMNAPEQ